MVDVELFAALLDALKPTARLLLIGDPNQLPSVGPGSVLASLLALGRRAGKSLASVALTEIFRQARSSLIVTGAHDVLAGFGVGLTWSSISMVLGQFDFCKIIDFKPKHNGTIL